MEIDLFYAGFAILIGAVLIWQILKRITPFDEYINIRPVKIVGLFSFGLIFLINFLIFYLF